MRTGNHHLSCSIMYKELQTKRMAIPDQSRKRAKYSQEMCINARQCKKKINPMSCPGQVSGRLKPRKRKSSSRTSISIPGTQTQPYKPCISQQRSCNPPSRDRRSGRRACSRRGLVSLPCRRSMAVHLTYRLANAFHFKVMEGETHLGFVRGLRWCG